MTREEAIKIIDCYDLGFYDLSGAKIPADKLADAFDMAIEALSAEAVTHGRLIDADALSEKLCKTTIFVKDGEKFQRMVNDAPTVSAEARPIQTRNCDGCDIFTMAEELAKALIDACADEIVKQIKDSRVECRDCKHHHTSEMYEYCDVIAVKGRRQRAVEYCSLGERKGGESDE